MESSRKGIEVGPWWGSPEEAGTSHPSPRATRFPLHRSKSICCMANTEPEDILGFPLPAPVGPPRLLHAS